MAELRIWITSVFILLVLFAVWMVLWNFLKLVVEALAGFFALAFIEKAQEQRKKRFEERKQNLWLRRD